MHLNAFILRKIICKKDCVVVLILVEFVVIAPSNVPDLQCWHIVKSVVNFEEFLAICLFSKHSAGWDVDEIRCVHMIHAQIRW